MANGVLSAVGLFLWNSLKASGRLAVSVIPVALLATLLERQFGVSQQAIAWGVIVPYALLLVVLMHAGTRFGRWLKGDWL